MHWHTRSIRDAALAAMAMTCVLLSGCATQIKEQDIAEIPHTLSPSYGSHVPKRVAILPFENAFSEDDSHPDPVAIGKELESRAPEDIARETFYKHFSILPFEDVELRQVDRTLAGTKTRHQRAMAARDKLGADTIIHGKLKRYYHIYAIFVAYTNVAAEVEMVNAHTGKAIWSSDHTEFGFDFSLGVDFWNLIVCGYREYIWRRELRRRFDDLFNDMVKTIPGRKRQLLAGAGKQ